MKGFALNIFRRLRTFVRFLFLTIIFVLQGFVFILFDDIKIISFSFLTDLSDQENDKLSFINRLNQRIYGDDLSADDIDEFLDGDEGKGSV